jgi:capsular polysaccharide biosynthesis protein
VLVELTVRSPKAKRAEDGANALAKVIKAKTTSTYVKQSIAAYQTLLTNFTKREGTLTRKIAVLNGILNSSAGKSLAPLDQLVLAQELDTAEGTLGATINSITTTQQQLTLAQQIETTQIIQVAKASKTTARSRRNSVLFGALIGLLAGAIIAIVVGLRSTRPAATA